MAPVALVVLALLVGSAGSVKAGRIYDPAIMPKARYVAPLADYPDPSYRAKDFSVIKKGDWYHLFYTRVQRFVPHHWEDGTRAVLNETSFGHAISTDLETWTELDTVLAIRRVEGAWDQHHVWAPSLYEHDGVTWMVFTGVRDLQQSTNPADWIPRWQVIGAAYSTDPMLQTWVRLLDPVFQPCAGPTCGGVPWALCTPRYAGYSADFRDPFVLPPPAGSDDPWLLFYTARVRWDSPNYAAGVAQGPGPGGPWTDVDALWDTYYLPANSKIESPHVFRRGNELNLLFSGDDGTVGIVWQTSAGGSPLGPWQTKPRLSEFLAGVPDVPNAFELEPEAWFASEQWSETTPAGTVDYLAVVHSYDAPPRYNPPAPAAGEDISAIEFRRIVWDDANGTFRLVAPNLARAVRSSVSELEVGESLALEIDSESGKGERVELGAAIVDGDRTIVIDPTAVGLPMEAVLTGPTTTVPWTVNDSGLQLPITLRISIANQPLRPATTVVLRGSSSSEELPGSEPSIVRVPGQREVRLVAQRSTAGAGAGPGNTPELALDLPQAGRARIALYDVTGRLVRTLVDDTLPAGSSSWRWDGLDAQGRPAPRGLYFARLTTAQGAATARVALGR